MDRNDRSITEIFFLLEVCLLGLLEGACIGWKSITEIFFLGSRLMRLLEVACMGWRSITEIVFLLRSKYRFLFGLLVWVGLGLRGFITEMDRNDRSITEIFFLLEVCLLGLLEGACIGWKSITEIIRCRSSFATARKRKQAFFLLVLNRKSLSCFARNIGFCIGCVALPEKRTVWKWPEFTQLCKSNLEQS